MLENEEKKEDTLEKNSEKKESNNKISLVSPKAVKEYIEKGLEKEDMKSINTSSKEKNEISKINVEELKKYEKKDFLKAKIQFSILHHYNHNFEMGGKGTDVLKCIKEFYEMHLKTLSAIKDIKIMKI